MPRARSSSPTTANRLTNRSWPGLLTAALLFFIPCPHRESPAAPLEVMSMCPLSVLYLTTAAYLVVYSINHDAGAWRIYACSLALLPWVKREGAILWAVAALCGAVIICRERRWFSLLWLTPGVLLMASWKIFLVAMKTADAREFTPMNSGDAPGKSFPRSPDLSPGLRRVYGNDALESLLADCVPRFRFSAYPVARPPPAPSLHRGGSADWFVCRDLPVQCVA